MEFTIRRSKWLRGEVDAVLLRQCDGKQCCIGQIASQLGVPNESLLEVGCLSDIDDKSKASCIAAKLIDAADQCSANWVIKAYRINDNQAIDDATRESRLRELAAANGHTLTFAD